MKFIDYLLGRFQGYRKFTGGTWYLCAPWPSMPYIDPAWVRGKVMPWERVFETEVWPK